jgi:predicted Zn-dependent protease
VTFPADLFAENSLTLHLALGDSASSEVRVRRVTGTSVAAVVDGVRRSSARSGQVDAAHLERALRELGTGRVDPGALNAVAIHLGADPHVDALAALHRLAEAAYRGAHAAGAHRVTVVGRTVLRRTSTLRTSTGAATTADVGFTRLRVTVGDDRGCGTAGLVIRNLAAVPVEQAERLGAEAVADAALGAQSVTPRSAASVDVVLSASAAGFLVHEAIGHALEGTRASVGYALRAPGVRLDPRLVVTERPAALDAWQPAEHDDEGVPTRDVVLLGDGQVMTTLTTAEESPLGDGPAGGNARRAGYGMRAMPRMRHTDVSPGRTPFTRLIEGVGEGFVVDDADFALASPVDGSFTLRVRRARRIAGGRPAEPLKDFALRGGLEQLRDLAGIGDVAETHPSICGRADQWLPVSSRSPALAVRGLQIVGGRT